MDVFLLFLIGIAALSWTLLHVVGGWYGIAGDMAFGIVGAVLGGYLLMAAIGGIVLLSIFRIFRHVRSTPTTI